MGLFLDVLQIPRRIQESGSEWRLKCRGQEGLLILTGHPQVNKKTDFSRKEVESDLVTKIKKERDSKYPEWSQNQRCQQRHTSIGLGKPKVKGKKRKSPKKSERRQI